MIDDLCRLALAQWWVASNADSSPLADVDLDAVARALARLTAPDFILWPHFAAALDELHAPTRDALGRCAGWATDPRPTALDHELILAVEHPPGPVTEDAHVPAVRFAMHLTERGWQVAGLDGEPVTPWPSVAHLVAELASAVKRTLHSKSRVAF